MLLKADNLSGDPRKELLALAEEALYRDGDLIEVCMLVWSGKAWWFDDVFLKVEEAGEEMWEKIQGVGGMWVPAAGMWYMPAGLREVMRLLNVPGCIVKAADNAQELSHVRLFLRAHIARYDEIVFWRYVAAKMGA